MTELETERNELQVKARSYKAELVSLKEEYGSKMKSVEALQSERDELYIKVEEFSSRMASWQSMEVEYKSYRTDTEVKLTKFVELDEDVFRLKAEIEELKSRN